MSQKTPFNYFLDSNILLRFLKGDGSSQQKKQVKKIFAHIQEKKMIAYLHSLVLYEAIYVLLYVYKQKKSQVVTALLELLKLDNLRIVDLPKEQITKALYLFKQHKVDFPDCLFAQLVDFKQLQLLSFDNDSKKLGIKRADFSTFS